MMNIIIISLALGGMQVIWVALTWMVSPLRPLAYLACLAWVMSCLYVVRHRAWIGGLPRPWERWLCLLLWQLPGLLCSACAIALFTGFWQAPAIAVFLLQVWLQPLAPLIALVPRANCQGTADYLWVAASLPVMWYLVTAAIAAFSRQPMTLEADRSGGATGAGQRHRGPPPPRLP